MEKKEILKFCVENGFFLDKGMLDFFLGLGDKEFMDIIKRLKGLGINEKILTETVFEKYKGRIDCFLSSFEKVDSEVKILEDIKINSGKIEARDFVSYFRSRFEVLRDILMKNGKLENLSSIRRIGMKNGVFCVIGMVYSKRVTKNKNLLIEIEDLTGRSVILVNKENKELFERAQGLLLDDIVAFNVSGSVKMLFVSDFVYPGAGLKKEVFGNKSDVVAFISDLHIGSKMFLEGNLMKFINWLNGNVGDKRQRDLAGKVRYLVVGGDNIDGVGVYPGQERFLKIKGCKRQYEKLAEILGKIRKSVEIVMCPGQHDAVWVGEPQPAILEKWGGSLSKLDNLRLVSNPSVFEIGGLKILVYHGGNLNKFIDESEYIRINYGHRCPTKVIKEILKRRHLAPIYGEMDIVPNKEMDDLVLKGLPDVFVIGGQHRAMIENYNNILIVSTSCWQSKTDFEDKIGSEPEFCRVPILNLKSKEIKILDFSENEIKWESGSDLVCELGGGK